ncbi:DUF3795 domain-containing protein [Desulfoluna butyratoxydans]|uniref:DUF3795 domain-containing protein n=1 Tax=Desulfoluna butyratoxydans TaxID=231438 RepID=UPI0015D141AA|nr:DUF3795 domain-containing protein [Desulfoluna butyratoxydans]
MPNKLIAYCGLYCGLYCGACSFKVAFDTNERDHIECMPAKYEKFRDLPLEFCPGCRLENQCGKCEIKDCAEKKEIEFCSQCNEFPCIKLENFNNDGIPHHYEAIKNLLLLKEIGTSEWIALQRENWECKCGSKYSWYLKKCKKCSSYK